MDQSSISAINKYTILSTLFSGGNKSRADLAKELKLSKPAVADNISDLITLGIINEIGEGESSKTGGRKPIILEFNKSYRYIISVDLSLEKPVCALGNLKSELIGKNIIHVEKYFSKEEYLDAAVQSIDSVMNQHKLSKYSIGAIVISTPGIVKEDGEYFFSNPQHENWTQIGLKDFLFSHYNIPVLIKNDVNLAVMAEMEIGTGEQHSNIIYISCGLGLGSGIVLGGKIYEGRNHAAGEIGYFTDSNNLEEGKTLEEEVKLSTILKKINKDIKNGQNTIITSLIPENEELEYNHVVMAYNQGDDYIKEIIYSIGTKLGIAISNIVSLLDLNIVVLGGLYAESDCSSTLLNAVNDVMSKNKLFNPIIKVSNLKTNGSIIGSFVIGSEYVIKSTSK